MPSPFSQQVLEIWQKLFPDANVSYDASFFTLGGDSLAATSMALAVEKCTGSVVPVGQIYLTPVLKDFIAYLRSEASQSSHKPLFIPIKHTGTDIPIFGVAPAVGGIFHFRELSRALAENQPLYVLEPKISASGTHAYESVEDLVNQCVGIIKSKRTQGPYRLCGYSFGGFLAWEIACVLEAQGELVDFVILFDACSRDGIVAKDEDHSKFARIAAEWKFLQLGYRSHRKYGRKISLNRCSLLIWKKFTNSFQTRTQKQQERVPVKREDLDASDMEVPVQKFFRKDFELKPLKGSAVLIRAEEQLTFHREIDYDFGWSRYLPNGGPVIFQLKGSHFTLLQDPNVQAVARTIDSVVKSCALAEDEQIKAEIRAAAALKFPPYEEPVKGESLMDRLIQVAEAFPHKIAVRDAGIRMTYEEVLKKAKLVAAFLIHEDPGGTEPILLNFKSSWQFLVSACGVLLAGRYYVPVDIDFPKGRLEEIIRSSNTKVAICKDDTLLRSIDSTSIQINTFKEVISSQSVESKSLPLQTSPDSPAVLLYTSGSTGKPKGTVISHKYLAHSIWRRVSGLDFRPTDRCAMLYLSSFKGGLTSMFAPICAGATLCFFDPPRQGLDELILWLERERITSIHLITSIVRRFLQKWRGEPPLPDLRMIIPGGEKTRESDFELFRRYCTDKVKFCTCLGSTETGTLSIFPMSRDYNLNGGPIPIGKPFPSMNVHVVRPNGSRTDPGEDGEIVVESEYIFTGYLNTPPTSNIILTPEGKTKYYTGDYGFFDEAGILYNLGRKDSRIKINGNLVELEEVESAIMSSGLVLETVVLYRPVNENDLEPRLIAYYNPILNTADILVELRLFLSHKLTKSMLPTHWVEMKLFPQTSNGKTDRKALADMPIR